MVIAPLAFTMNILQFAHGVSDAKLLQCYQQGVRAGTIKIFFVVHLHQNHEIAAQCFH